MKIIEKLVPKIYRITDKGQVNLKPIYSTLIEIVRKVKSDLNVVLYNNNLIYITKEEVSIDEIKEEGIYKASTAG